MKESETGENKKNRVEKVVEKCAQNGACQADNIVSLIEHSYR